MIVDDPPMLMSYHAVFMFSCFKLRANDFSSLTGSETYQRIMSQGKNAASLSDLSFETKSLWTILDYLYSYCHLLDVVLGLILITGTLEYDILHLGYLAFALIFSRMRLEILKKMNKIFKFLRLYNFVLIVLSLAHQSPFLGYFSEGKSKTIGYISKVISFHKYDYGFRITSRSALVEIIIFMLVSLQSCFHPRSLIMFQNILKPSRTVPFYVSRSRRLLGRLHSCNTYLNMKSRSACVTCKWRR